MLNNTEAEAKRLLIAVQRPRGHGRPAREYSQLLPQALALIQRYLPAVLFELLCALTRAVPAKLDEPQRTKAQRKIFELDVKSNARLSHGQIAQRVGVSRQYACKQRTKNFSTRISEIITRRLNERDKKPQERARPPEVSVLIQQIKRLGGTFPVRSPIDQQLYHDAESYAHHLYERNIAFSVADKPLALLRNCWSESTGPDVARYERIFEGTPRKVVSAFPQENTGGRVHIIIPGEVVSVLVKNVDDSVRERWPRECAEFEKRSGVETDG